MKKVLFLFSLFIASLTFPKAIFAVCPVCTIAVGAGLGLSRFLGIDDTVSGVWVGGLILSSSFWLVDWLEKKNFKWLSFYHKFQLKKEAIIALMYIIVLLPLWSTKIIGHTSNTILGTDKLIFGTIVGSLAFIAGMFLDKKVREVRGSQIFHFQKVAFPVSLLIIASIILFLITSVKIAFI